MRRVMYAIDFDERTRVLTTVTEGMWTLATLAGFSAAVLARGLALKIRYGQFATVNDARLHPVQTNEVAKGIEFLMAKSLAISTAPMVTIVGSQLGKMQAERVLRAPHSRVFVDYDEAMAWLDAEWISKLTTA